MDLITKALSVLSPSAAFKRMQYMKAISETDDFMNKRKYEGAGRGRRLGAWGLSNGSPNTENQSSLEDLRSRAKMLAQNNPYAKNAPKRIANNVVGTGILLTPVHAGKDKQQESKLKEAWKQWADTTSCDFNEQLNFYGLQHLVMRSIPKNGEALVRRIKRKYKKGQVPLEIQILDTEFIDTQKNTLRGLDGTRIISGIEYNAKGKRVAYWLFKDHPKDGYTESKRVKAEDICHIYDMDDAGQVRGITDFASIILRMKDFDEYEDAQLYKQKIASCFVAFRSKAQDITPKVSGATPDRDRAGNLLDRMAPGVIEDLNPGETITFGTPPTTEGFAEYSRQNLQGQAVGLGMSYESFTGDLSNVNFSSGRMGWIEFGRNIEHWQWNMMVPMFLNRVFYWFLEAYSLTDENASTDFTPTWTPPRREMIDPTKEIKAMVQEIRGGLVSWHDAVKQRGYNPDELLAEMISSKNAFDAAGVLPECDPRYDAEQRRVKLEKETDD